MIVFLTFGQEFSRVLHTFGTDTSNWEERRCVSRDAVPRTCCFGGGLREIARDLSRSGMVILIKM